MVDDDARSLPTSDWQALIWRLEDAGANCTDERHRPALHMAAHALRTLNELSTYVMSTIWTQDHQPTPCRDAEHCELLRKAADMFNVIETMIPDGLRYLAARTPEEFEAIRADRVQRLGDQLVRLSRLPPL